MAFPAEIAGRITEQTPSVHIIPDHGTDARSIPWSFIHHIEWDFSPIPDGDQPEHR